MKISSICRQTCGSLLAISLATIPFTTVAQAQIDSEPEAVLVEEENDFDWGWLGLLGLLGLAGLAGKNNNNKREVRNTESFPETTERSNL